MAYMGYLERVNAGLSAMIESVDVIHNFDHGIEFEIALCTMLRKVLPQKYGICRGFAVTIDDKYAGDDIIIYDRERFSALRLLDQEDYSRKQYIPIEAVYAYIEAKNTLSKISKNGEDGNYNKAIQQVSSVKELQREAVPRAPALENWPGISNPIYGVIWGSRFRRSAAGDEDKPEEEIHESFEDILQWAGGESQCTAPDLIVAGTDFVSLPCLNGNQIHSPFFIRDRTLLTSVKSKGKACGIAVVNLLWALESIQLGNMQLTSLLSRELVGSERPGTRSRQEIKL